MSAVKDDDLPTPLCRVGRPITTTCMRGIVLELTWGPSRNWRYAQWYYLVRPGETVSGKIYEPHWFREEEVIVDFTTHPRYRL